MATVKHKFSTGKADGTDTTFVKPSNWNEDHDALTAAGSVYLGRDATGPGPVQEFPINHAATGDDMTMYTKAQIDALIAGLVPAAETGDLIASVNYNKTGWLQCNGQTIGNVGSAAVFANASAHGLFTLFWTSIFGVDWPINGGRGASAEADWLALKTIPLPDARGRTLAMIDQGANVATLLNIIGATPGEQFHRLSIFETPPHAHAVHLPDGAYGGFGAGGYQPGGNLANAAPLINTDMAGGDAGVTDPHLNMQPSLAIVYHIKL